MHLVLGSSVEALRFCQNTESVLLPTTDEPPHFFEETYFEWGDLVLNLSLQGKLKHFQKIKKIWLEKDYVEILLTNNNKRKIEFMQCEVYGTSGVEVNCSDIVKTDTHYLVYDWLDAVSLGGSHLGEKIYREEEFVKNIWFYKSNKILCKSKLTLEQLYDVKYSDVYCKFLLMNELRSAGFHGRKNGIDKSGRQKFLNLDLSVTRRDVLPKTESVYLDTERVKFRDSSGE